MNSANQDVLYDKIYMLCMGYGKVLSEAKSFYDSCIPTRISKPTYRSCTYFDIVTKFDAYLFECGSKQYVARPS